MKSIKKVNKVEGKSKTHKFNLWLHLMTIRSKIIISSMLPVIFIIVLGVVSFQKTSYGINTNY
jgi:hypothetical protein